MKYFASKAGVNGNMQTGIAFKAKSLFKMGAFKRVIITWIIFQGVLWLVFGIIYYLNLDAWNMAPESVHGISNSDGCFRIFLGIIANNLILFLLIVIGNMFVRFGAVTPGLVILLIQGIMIGYVAGTNSFEIPFNSVVEANLQYLRVGLWETTAYALICGVTMTKSLYIADSFPAKQWTRVRTLRDIKFSITEKIFALISVLLLVIAAYIEAIYIVSI